MSALAAVAMASAGVAQVAAPGPGPQLVRRPMAPPPARTGDRADLAATLMAGLPVIEVTVNGKGPFRLGVETGFPGYLRLTPEAAARGGLSQIGEAMTSDPSGRNPQRVPLFAADKVEIGGLSWSGVQITVAPILSERLNGVDGLVGLGFFRDLLLKVDYGKGRFSLAPGALAEGPGVLPVTGVRGMLLSFPLTIGARTWPVHLDTGNTRAALFMPAAAIPELPTSGAAYPIGTARTISQQVTLSAMKLAAPVSAGGTVLPVTEVAYPAIAEEGNLGSLGMAGQMLTLDLANGRMRLAPSGR